MKKITQAEYDALRAKMIEEHKQFLTMQGAEEIPTIVLTCDDCLHRFDCEFAADLYNTNGDCLASK